MALTKLDTRNLDGPVKDFHSHICIFLAITESGRLWMKSPVQKRFNEVRFLHDDVRFSRVDFGYSTVPSFLTEDGTVLQVWTSQISSMNDLRDWDNITEAMRSRKPRSVSVKARFEETLQEDPFGSGYSKFISSVKGTSAFINPWGEIFVTSIMKDMMLFPDLSPVLDASLRRDGTFIMLTADGDLFAGDMNGRTYDLRRNESFKNFNPVTLSCGHDCTLLMDGKGNVRHIPLFENGPSTAELVKCFSRRFRQVRAGYGTSVGLTNSGELYAWTPNNILGGLR